MLGLSEELVSEAAPKICVHPDHTKRSVPAQQTIFNLLVPMQNTRLSAVVSDDDPMLIALRSAVDATKRQDMFAALKAISSALAIDPKRADLWQDLGAIYARLETWTLCVTSLEIALVLEPGRLGARYVMALALYYLGKHKEAVEMIDDVCKRSPTPIFWAMRAYIHAHTNRDAAHSLQVHQDWGRRFADPLTRKAKPLLITNRNPQKRLKVGYVTADFRQHSVFFFMLPVLHHHNPSEVEIHVYSSGVRDAYTDIIQESVPHWHEIADLTDEALCTRIREDGIDILVDLSGHTAGHRLLTFARRAAPVQVTWLGYNLPTGLKAMDYRITDAEFSPLGQEVFFNEKLFRISCIACYQPPNYAPLCKSSPMLRNGYPTLVSLNNSAKITDAMLVIWSRILHARHDARLIIMVKERSADAAQASMQSRIEAAGMPLDRVSVLHQQSLDNFMEMGHIADIALDTAPISGGTTTLHALWMGLPVVALDAERGLDAATARVLQSIGGGGEVTKNEDEYVAAVLKMMNDEEYLLSHRKSARDMLLNSKLMNYANLVKEVECAFRMMWINYINKNTNILSFNILNEKRGSIDPESSLPTEVISI
jgi:predicted O-linked N-acetylglucosamine transferase (SPINDLY family)